MSLKLTPSLAQPGYLPGAPQAIYAQLDFAPHGVSGRMPIDLRVVLDNSGSMTNDAAPTGGQTKIALLKQAVGAMLDRLEPGDHLTLVSFEDHGKLLWSGPVTGTAALQAAQKALQQLRGGGGTMISRGLTTALKAPPLPDHVGRLVLVTDGETSNDEAECAQLAFDQRGVAQWLVFGIGVDYNDAFLDQLAQANGGIFVHLGDMQGATAVFEREVAVMGEIALTNLVVNVEPMPGFTLTRADRIVPQVLSLPVHDPRFLAVDLGDVDRARGQKVLLQLASDPMPPGDVVVARIRCAYHVPARKLLNQTLELELVARFDAEAARHAPDADVLRTAQLAGASRLYTLGLAEAAAGQGDASARTLSSAAGLYDALGLDQMGDKLRTLTSGLTTRGAMDEDVKRTLTTMARQAWSPSTPPTPGPQAQPQDGGP